MDSMTLVEAKNKRAHIRAAATRLKTYIENYDHNLGSRHDIIERKTKLSDLWNQFELVQSRIETLENSDPANTDKDALLAQQIQQRASFETPYFYLVSRYDAMLEHFNQREAPASTSSNEINNSATNIRQSRVRLPKIELPVFSGSYEDWYSYQDTFEKLIHMNDSLANIEKFHYLRSSLKDKAAEVIKSIEITTDNYHEAWAAIKERFDNKRWIINKHIIKAMFEAPALSKENHTALRELLDTIFKHVRALKALKRPTESWDDLIIHIISSKLDPATSKAWETSITHKDMPDLKSLTDFLSKRCQALESIFCKSSNNQLNSVTQKYASKYKNHSVSNDATSNLSCPQCKENHQLYHCEAFLKSSVDKRIQIAKKAHICTNCLRSTEHKAKMCKSGPCRKCSKKHNTLLHLLTSNNEDASLNSKQSLTDSDETPHAIVTQCSSIHHSLNILLSTAIIHVYDSRNQPISCRVLLDSGSQMNFITERLADRLHLKEQLFETSIAGVMQGSFQANRMINLRVKSRFNNFSEVIDCIVLPKITQDLLQRFICTSNIVIPKNIKLADPNFNVPSSIDLLIGADLFWKLICAGQIKHSKNQPVLQKTQFGWVISGNTTGNNVKPIPSSSCHLVVADDLNRALSRFWEVEHNISSPNLSIEEHTCESLFQNTVRRDVEGRFIVQLPIKTDKLADIGDSKDIAMRRFKALEDRLVKQPKMYAEYKKFIHEYRDLGHMREVLDHLESDPFYTKAPLYYLPHHAVYKETSSTTKIRVVFDGSCKTSSGISLNDVLMVGPTVQDDLFSILTRFRTFKYALTADIAKMYRQVLVDPEQTSLQRILWRDSPNESVKTFELLTVTYGTASASYLAIRALRKLAEENSNKFSVAAKVVLNDFYVDDLVTSTDSLEEAFTIKTETTQLLQEGKFELRKWASNIPALQDNQAHPNHKEFILSADKHCETRTLGIMWNCNTDEFQFSSIVNLPPLEKLTKRSILSRIALVFDPLGLLGPATLTAKIIMQDLWRLRINWDESIPLEVHTKWRRYEMELPTLRKISVPRRVIPFDQYIHLELHGFSDASELAYGACIYLRATSVDGKHSTNLLCSKNRVAPLKALSIPRLELCAALLLAQLTNKIINCLTCNINSVCLWTDSTIVLSWLQSCSRIWTPFVANRVGEIQLTAIQNWKHIRSEDNPADPLSRGVMPTSLSQLHIWWNGPHWLSLDKEKWPQFPVFLSNEDIPEARTIRVTALVTNEQEFNIFNRYSKFTKLIRVVAYIFRFFKNTRHIAIATRDSQKAATSDGCVTQPVSADETTFVIQVLVKLVQKTCFSKELHSLSSQRVVDKNSYMLRLNPFIDENGILRVGGRLRASTLPNSAKHPILLPGRHPLCRLIVTHEHERHCHAGPQATLSAVRQNYWLISARDVVRQITRNCITCFKNAPKTTSTIMGDLPKSRITVPTRVFERCGVDYAGPFYYKVGLRKATKLIKCYMAIFVCFSTKAIHIELASDLTSEAFLNIFKRFISRRGYPSDMYSDNGLNFVGAERELSELTTLLNDQKTQHQIIGYMSDKRIQWHFIPPRAPHHGGLWEAAVKAAKYHILRITKDTHLKYEELQTLLVQVEAILNSRPLTPMSSDPADITPLTAGHFLIGSPLTSYPEPSLEKLSTNRLSRWQHVEQLRQHFWRRWLKEYLHHCQQRNKWQSNNASIYKGQMVILREDNVPPLSWPLGRIIEVHPGDDGVIRTVTVRTVKTSYKRPITRLCLLPLEDNN